MEKLIILIDFDGTCVTHAFPRVGKDVGAVPVLKRLVEAGHDLVLFTMRSYDEGISPVTGKMEDGGLKEAVQWFEDNGIPLYGINKTPGQDKWTSSPKAYGHMIIDESALGCPVLFEENGHAYADWFRIEIMLEKNGII